MNTSFDTFLLMASSKDMADYIYNIWFLIMWRFLIPVMSYSAMFGMCGFYYVVAIIGDAAERLVNYCYAKKDVCPDIVIHYAEIIHSNLLYTASYISSLSAWDNLQRFPGSIDIKSGLTQQWHKSVEVFQQLRDSCIMRCDVSKLYDGGIRNVAVDAYENISTKVSQNISTKISENISTKVSDTLSYYAVIIQSNYICTVSYVSSMSAQDFLHRFPGSIDIKSCLTQQWHKSVEVFQQLRDRCIMLFDVSKLYDGGIRNVAVDAYENISTKVSENISTKVSENISTKVSNTLSYYAEIIQSNYVCTVSYVSSMSALDILHRFPGSIDIKSCLAQQWHKSVEGFQQLRDSCIILCGVSKLYDGWMNNVAVDVNENTSTKVSENSITKVSENISTKVSNTVSYYAETLAMYMETMSVF